MSRRLRSTRVATSGEIDEKRTEIYFWWLLLAIFFEYARPGAFVPGIDAVKLNSLIPLSLLAVTLVAPGLRPFGQIFADRHARWLSAYFGLIVLSVPFADVTEYSFTIFKKVLGYFFLFLIIARVATSVRRLHGIFVALILSHMFLIAMTPAVVLNPEVRTYIRGGTFLGDGNDFSLSLCILLPMAIEIFRSARSRVVSILALAGLIIMLLAIIGTQSRGATLAMCGVFMFLWVLSKRKVMYLAVMLIGSLGVLIYASDAYFTRMGTMKDYHADGSAEGRILAWSAATRMVMDHPLMGVGTGHFPVAYGAKYMRRDLGSMPWLTAHSMYFLVLGEMGLSGIIALCALVFGAMFATMKSRRLLLSSGTDPPVDQSAQLALLLQLLTASLVAFAIAGAFLSVAYYPHVFVLTGILVAARAVALPSSESVAGPRARRAHTVKAYDRRVTRPTVAKGR